jgi:hypothetical protein
VISGLDISGNDGFIRLALLVEQHEPLSPASPLICTCMNFSARPLTVHKTPITQSYASRIAVRWPPYSRKSHELLVTELSIQVIGYIFSIRNTLLRQKG